MNSNILDKPLILSLNAVWQPIRHRTAREALVAMNGGSKGNPPAVGVDLVYEKNADGTWDFERLEYCRPVKWDEWVTLPVRDFDLSISTIRGLVRVPTVIVSLNYSDMPMRDAAPTRENVYARDQGICQISGRFVGREGGNLEHVHPQGRGGDKRTWENQVWADKELNTRKGCRTLDEMGWKLIRKPKAPPKVPVCVTLREVRHPDWKHFIV
jgi:hypothetical protein